MNSMLKREDELKELIQMSTKCIVCVTDILNQLNKMLNDDAPVEEDAAAALEDHGPYAKYFAQHA